MDSLEKVSPITTSHDASPDHPLADSSRLNLSRTLNAEPLPTSLVLKVIILVIWSLNAFVTTFDVCFALVYVVIVDYMAE